MTFNDDAQAGQTRVRRRGARAGGGIAIGGGAAIVLFLLSQLLNVDLGGLVGGGDPGTTGGEQETSLEEECRTGADANASIDCRMVFAWASMDDYWAETYPAMGGQYASPTMDLFTGGVSTGCGDASSAMGPFYCPPDTGIYLDTAFFDQLTTQLGAEGGPLAEMYVVAHEWGHHIQNLSGTMDQMDRQDTGPTSDAVRLELQADCFAGAWAGAATQTEDAQGVPFLEPFTPEQLASALDAAATVGDDHIQEQQGGQAHPESWTHGSSEQRQGWFQAGLDGGPQACDTFGIDGSQL